MTDEEILAEAARIKARRLNQARLASFEAKSTVTIRWDVPGSPFGESYCGIEVPASAVAAVVAGHFAPLIERKT